MLGKWFCFLSAAMERTQRKLNLALSVVYSEMYRWSKYDFNGMSLFKNLFYNIKAYYNFRISKEKCCNKQLYTNWTKM